MKHLRKVRGLVWMLILSMILSVCTVPTSVLAAGTPAIEMSFDKTSYVYGGEVLLTLRMTEAAGIAALQVDIDMEGNTFVLEKLEILDPSLEGAMAGTKGNRLSVNWIAGGLSDVSVQPGDVFRLRMRVRETAASGNKMFSVSNIEAYNSKMDAVAVEKGKNTSVEVKAAAKSQNVINAENEIAKINLDAITTSKESLDLITNAQQAFSRCSAAEKKQVSNADVLNAAVKKYNALKEEEAKADAEAKIQQELADYRNNYYNEFASTTPETVKLADKAGITAAIKEYTKKSSYVRSLLKPEYDHLKELEAAVKVLEEKASAESYADTFVPVFLENNKDILNMPVDSITYEDENVFGQLQSKIADAIDFHNTILNDVGRGRVTKEYQHLLALAEKCEEIAVENTPDTPGVTAAYNGFRDKYMDLLMKSPDEVTMEDLDAINSAISEIKNMKPAVSGKLLNEYEYLMELLSTLNGTGAGDNWPDDNWPDDNWSELPGDDVTVPGEVVTPPNGLSPGGDSNQNGENSKNDGRKTKVNVTVGDAFAIILLVMLLTTVLLYLIPTIVKFILKKKQERRAKYGTES